MPRTTRLADSELRRLARVGAEVRLGELRAEVAAIERTFPELGRAAGGTRNDLTPRPTRKKRRQMTAAQKQAISERMRRYWADRKRRPKG